MTEVRWTEQATENLEAIKAFISQDSPAYALAVVGRLYHAWRAILAHCVRARPKARFGICYHGLRSWAEGEARPAEAPEEEVMSKNGNYPPGWNEDRVRRVLEHYEQQTDDEAVAEDEASFESTTNTAMEVPVELVPKIREMIAKRRRTA